MQVMVSNESQRAEQHAWIRAVLAQTGLNLNQLAKKIGRSGSTLHRPMNDPGNTTMISSRVLAEIAGFAGLRVMEFPGRQKGFSENEAVPYIYEQNKQEVSSAASAVKAMVGNRNGRDPWVVQTALLDMAGIIPGDILIVDLNKRPVSGDIVCAQLYDWTADRAETAFRIYDAPYLTSYSKQRTTKPIMVDDDTVKIMGVVDGLIRPKLT